MRYDAYIETADDATVVMTVKTLDEAGRVRRTRRYRIAKHPHQSAEEVARLACPEAFGEAA